jgi:hypothetical protein
MLARWFGPTATDRTGSGTHLCTYTWVETANMSRAFIRARIPCSSATGAAFKEICRSPDAAKKKGLS